MSSAQDGGPAYPTTRTEELNGPHGGVGATVDYPGMSLRDWFAGQALAGWLGDPSVGGDPAHTAIRMYEFADAMLAEREKVQS